ncbi:MAG: sugar ABC transporter permease, partial [Clostridia bacterium]|nr:sugar ABC transporter permease [Clostridia bacterium]
MDKVANFFKWIGNGFRNIGITFRDGDWKTRISFIIMGFGPILRKSFVRGISLLAMEILFIWYMVAFGWQYLCKLPTLGTEQTHMEGVITVYGDNSFLILLYGLLTVFIIIAFIVCWVTNVTENRREELAIKGHRPIPTVKQDLFSLLDRNIHKTLMTLPLLGTIIFMVLPIVFMICVAFTNYNAEHQAPAKLFTWVGLQNFASLADFGNGGMG